MLCLSGQKSTLEHISFSIKKGQTLGIIGATGSGKSTVIQLLLRFYDASSGKILINGRDIKSYTAAELQLPIRNGASKRFYLCRYRT